MAIITKEQLEQSSVDAGYLRRFRVGPASETIPTEEGLKPTIAGIVQQALQAASLDTLAGYTFATGVTITSENQGLLDTASGEYYRWTGTLPLGGKVVPAGATPASSGGIGPGKWLAAGQAALRSDLASTTGASLIQFASYLTGSIASTIANQLNGVVDLVKTFGAVGDGVNDDTLAFQRAYDSGANFITVPSDRKYFFRITGKVLVKRDNVMIDLRYSEIMMDDATGLLNHFLVGNQASQINNVKFYRVVLTNKFASTVAQIKAIDVGGLNIKACTGYGADKTHSFFEGVRCIIGWVRECTTEGLKYASVNLYGTGIDANRSVDFNITDNRFVGANFAVRIGDYFEGLFCRRNIFYAQKKTCVVIEPATKAAALGSIKLQEIDFDSPSLTDNFLYIQNSKNVQVTGCWFAGTLAKPMIRLEQTDSVIISDAQAYPADAFLLDNGVGTVVTSNMVVGGTVQIQFGALADKTLIGSNSMRGATSCVDAASHTKSLTISANKFESGSSAITDNSTNTNIRIYNNSGDNASGATTSSVVGATTPLTTYVGIRPEAISFRKASGVLSVSVNDVEVYNSTDAASPASFIGLGTLPPRSKIVVSFNTTNQPWLNRVKF